MTTTLSSREFNQDTSGAKKAAREGPVFITDRGRPAFVLIKIEDYRALTGGHLNVVDLLSMPETPDIDFDTQRVNMTSRPVELS
ncbi:type II toxin-antitoxin system Phd/YefM family antitoxin [Pseudomonas sp. v388]|uniref:type II toxin-antitoxin system Phd/YefM family antitoxin n=1 Tax=Pseudomonas sp. v388 TaxID=2479849 RepID=UPI000F79E460|nr:type II toxin-antitoxin system Phd/YefM family antitoxin [Pseudomonas sp. v388]RRV05662.1 type II toxin-antitoxin system Phd/YefM family antitoxin [Pseudomonas sp. v388]